MQLGLPTPLLCTLSLLAACTGAVGGSAARVTPGDGDGAGASGGSEGADDHASGGDGGGTGGEPEEAGGNEFPEKAPPPSNACKSEVPGPRTVRRLTGPQLTATMRDLFADATVPSTKVFDDPLVLGFRRDADKLVVRGLGAQQIMDYAEDVAAWAVANKLNSLSTCQQNDATCRSAFITGFGKRAFRAPLDSATVSSYEKLFAAEASFSDGAEAVIAAMLQSPRFLYRSELGQAKPGDVTSFALTPHEVASSLSYLLIGSMPDPALMAAADAGKLANAADIEVQVDRLLADDASQNVVAEFMLDWLELGHLETAVKNDASVNFDAKLRADMLAETRTFITDSYRQGGKLGDLFTAKHTFVNANLSSLYRLTGISGDTFSKITLDETERDGGILAHASILAGHANATGSSPTFRGKLVRTRLLCQDLPPPPANLNTMLKPPGSVATTRQRFEQHSTDPACAGCHNLMDPIGYAFERYDGFGRRREQENGVSIDSRGKITEVEGGDVAIDGLAALSRFLSTSSDVQNCAVRFWSYFAFGKSSWAEDACTYDAVKAEAAKDGFAHTAFLRALTRAPHFTQRVKDL